MTVISKTEFAARRGWAKSYVSKLANQGRLVLTEKGKIELEATEALLAQSADPSKAAVADRHHQDRLQRDVYANLNAQSASTSTAAQPPVDLAGDEQPNFQKARAHREYYLAQMAEMEFRKAQGALVEVSAVQKAAFETARSLNQSLLGMSSQLAPQLAAMSDPWEVERHLTAALRQRLSEAASVSSEDFGLRLE